MNAIEYKQYGSPDVLELSQVIKPSPKENEVLIRIKATAVNSGDLRLRKADPFGVRLFFGLRKPKFHILGSVFSGVVESVGKNVGIFKPGDEVFGHTNMKFGAYAEYICIPENGTITIKPKSISHQEAAVIPFGAVTALHFLKKVKIQPGQKVLIVGASGAVGSAAVQLTKSFGATVTGVCGTSNQQLVKSIGADEVIDYTQSDFTKNGEVYDLIFDAVNGISISKSMGSLAKNGKMILSAAGMSEMLQGMWVSLTGNKKIMTGVIQHSAADINFIRALVESGKFQPVIDRTYTLEQMKEAHAYVELGHKKGNVAIAV